MKVLVVSDSHGSSVNFSCAIEQEKDCKLVFFLGVLLNLRKTRARNVKTHLYSAHQKSPPRHSPLMKSRFPDRNFIGVRGNNDYSGELDEFAYKHIEGNTIVMCHGHTVGVKRSLFPLLEKAEGVRANVALYGHTHRSDIYFDSYSKIYAINPGCLFNGNYAVLTLSGDGVEVKFKNVFEVKD